jgi:UBX domain-containing protein 1/4
MQWVQEEIQKHGTGGISRKQNVRSLEVVWRGMLANTFFRDHSDFSESTEEIKPLTEEEKKQALEQLRQKAAARKANQAAIDKEEQKKNEVCAKNIRSSFPLPNPLLPSWGQLANPELSWQKIRMKATKEIQDAKEELAKNEQIKAAAAKRQEKLNDIAAKKRIQEKIAADKEARRLKAEQQKAEREGRAPPADPTITAAQSAQAGSSGAGSSGPKKEVTEARLRLQTNGGVVMKNFPVETTLFEVAEAVRGENGGEVESFTMTYPKKTFSGSLDFGKTLKEAGLVPSAVLIVK